MKVQAAFALVLAAGVQHALAGDYVCDTVRRGDTAARIAQRLTGSADDRYEPWFQIVDPTRSMVVPKSQYRRILPGWRACIATLQTTRANVVSVAADPAVRRKVDLPIAWWLALGVAWALVGWWVVERYLAARRATVRVMKRFGEKFVREFERPLVQPGAAECAVKSRLRFKPQKRQVEILLAPNRGHRYPNLSDHRKNVEYDVLRVLEQLRDEPFAGDRPYTRGPWVVVPCRLTAPPEQGGVR